MKGKSMLYKFKNECVLPVRPACVDPVCTSVPTFHQNCLLCHKADTGHPLYLGIIHTCTPKNQPCFNCTTCNITSILLAVLFLIILKMTLFNTSGMTRSPRRHVITDLQYMWNTKWIHTICWPVDMPLFPFPLNGSSVLTLSGRACYLNWWQIHN